MICQYILQEKHGMEGWKLVEEFERVGWRKVRFRNGSRNIGNICNHCRKNLIYCIMFLFWIWKKYKRLCKNKNLIVCNSEKIKKRIGCNNCVYSFVEGNPFPIYWKKWCAWEKSLESQPLIMNTLIIWSKRWRRKTTDFLIIRENGIKQHGQNDKGVGNVIR